MGDVKPELMMFAPLVLLGAFALWGVWQQRANPGLLRALVGGALLAFVAVSIGLGLSFVMAIVAVAVLAVAWAFSLCLR